MNEGVTAWAEDTMKVWHATRNTYPGSADTYCGLKNVSCSRFAFPDPEEILEIRQTDLMVRKCQGCLLEIAKEDG